jgi:5-methylcytosine-specific restriction endonuclease McrA
MLIKEYLDAKYGAGATTMLYCEAKAFGIPWPLPSGWIQKYGSDEISSNQSIALQTALQKSNKPSAAKGLQVLQDAWLVLQNTPEVTSRVFLASKAWKRLRYKALRLHGNKCQCCGASPNTGAVLNVDHILPRRLFPQHALQLENLQVLCADCNEGKGNWDMTSFKEQVV